MRRPAPDRPGALPFPGIRGQMSTVPDTSDDAIAAALEQVGPRLRQLRVRRGLTLTGVADVDRDLQEHALPPRDRRAPTDAGAVAGPVARLRRAARRSRGCARAGRPADPAQARTGEGQDGDPADPGAGGTTGLEDRHPDRQGHPGAAVPRRDTSGSTCCRAMSGSSSASRTPCSGTGDVATFDTDVPHWFGSTGDRPAEILSIFERPGEQTNVRTGSSDVAGLSARRRAGRPRRRAGATPRACEAGTSPGSP